MCHENPSYWSKWLPLAEFWYNCNFHTATKLTPFEIVYGVPPPIYRPYLSGTTQVEDLERSLQQRDEMMTALKQNLCSAQNRMQQMANKHRSERNFEIGDWVYLKLQHYRQTSVNTRPAPKLAAKYFGPYKIIKKVGAVAYTLQLPPTDKIHTTFHVSLLKRHHGPTPSTLDDTLPQPPRSVIERIPQSVLEIRSIKKNNAPVVQWLVQWQQIPVEEATWENAAELLDKFPNFDPWGQGSFNGGSIDTLHLEVNTVRAVAELEEGPTVMNEVDNKVG